MSVTTLKTLVLKTVTVGSVKLPTPADRIGLGFATVATAYPADVLSRRHFPVPVNPEPEPNGPRQEQPAVQTRWRMHAGGSAEAPAGSAGRLSPGSTARWCPWSLSGAPVVGAPAAAKRAAAARSVATTRDLPAGGTGRDRFPGFAGLHARLGRDCQSPDRSADRRYPAARRSLPGLGRVRGAIPAAAAGK